MHAFKTELYPRKQKVAAIYKRTRMRPFNNKIGKKIIRKHLLEKVSALFVLGELRLFLASKSSIFTSHVRKEQRKRKI